MIQQLDKQLTQDLCAQQVITSINDCVKQLVDNSIDSNATKIEIILEDYGKKSLVVADDGYGISDFTHFGQRGTTSKNDGNYQNAQTLGFRGQALHSIARVSQKMKIQTTTKDWTQTKCLDLKTLKQSQIYPQRGIGTSVTIQSLFQFLPVRRYQLLNKFKDFTKKIDSLIKEYSLIFPKICFILKNIRSDKTQILVETSKHINTHRQNWLNRIGQILGPKIMDKLIYINSEYIEGWLLKKIESGSSNENAFIRKNSHYMYLNKRPIDTIPKIVENLNNSYRKYKKNTKYIFILNLKIDKSSCDINLSPNKRQILLKLGLTEKINNQLNDFITANIIEDISNLQENPRKSKSLFGTQIIQKEQQQNQYSQIQQNDQIKNKHNFNNQIQQNNLIKIQQKSVNNKIENQSKNQVEPERNTTRKLTKHHEEYEKRIRQALNQRLKNNTISSGNRSKSISKQQINDNQKNQQPNNKSHFERKTSQIKAQNKSILPFNNSSIDNIIKKQKIDIQKKKHKNQNNEEDKADKQDKQKLGQWVEKRSNHTLNKQKFLQFKIVGQFNHGFIVCLYENDFYLVDQHAASEKYHFQRLLKSNRQQIQTCDQLKMTPIQLQTLEEMKDKLKLDGYSFQIQQGNVVILTKVPSFLGKIYGRQYFMDLLQDQKKLIQHRDFYMAAATKACRTAVMVGNILQKTEMISIVKELTNLQSPWNCPHGRPTLINLGKNIDFLYDPIQSYELD